MKEYKAICPEIITGLGEKTTYLETNPPFLTITKLHIELEDWLGDDLMLNSNCYIVTQRLKEALEEEVFTGFEFAEMEVTKSKYFSNNYQLNKALPPFYWMKILGKKDNDDIYMDNLDLNISVPFLDFLKKNFQTQYLEIDPIYDKETDDFIMSLILRDSTK